MITFITICKYITFIMTCMMWFGHFIKMIKLWNEYKKQGINQIIGGILGIVVVTTAFFVTIVNCGAQILSLL